MQSLSLPLIPAAPLKIPPLCEYKCPRCAFRYDDEQSARSHLIHVHGDSESSPLEIVQNWTAMAPIQPRQSQRNTKSLKLPTKSEENTVRCEICYKYLRSINSIVPLLCHAKRHCRLKQFACPECSYQYSESTSVRAHMKVSHKLDDQEPIDNRCRFGRIGRNSALEDSWFDVAAQCFPSMTQKLFHYQFRKNFRKKNQHIVKWVPRAAAEGLAK